MTAPKRYVYTAPEHRFTSFAELHEFFGNRLDPASLRRFLPGQFVFEIADKRKRELLETPEAMAVRLEARA